MTDDSQMLDCNCLALRQAARHVSQFYDEVLAPAGLRGTQFSILAKLARVGPMTINALAASMVMDRTTLGRNILPLQRDGLVSVEIGTADRRSRELRLTKSGAERYRNARKLWTGAQSRFEATFGKKRSAELRAELRSVAASDFAAAA